MLKVVGPILLTEFVTFSQFIDIDEETDIIYEPSGNYNNGRSNNANHYDT